jgi:hypothetical protein
MNMKYFGLILLLCMPHISKTMQAHFSTIIKFNGKKKSLYDWIHDDHNQEFGLTPIFNMMTKSGREPNDHYYEANHVNKITPEQLNHISLGLYIYCKDLETKTIHSKKIKYGALALAFNPFEITKEMTALNKATFYGKTDDISKTVILQSHLLQADYLKKSFEEKNKSHEYKKDVII